jgi:hypothetical protein
MYIIKICWLERAGRDRLSMTLPTRPIQDDQKKKKGKGIYYLLTILYPSSTLTVVFEFSYVPM